MTVTRTCWNCETAVGMVREAGYKRDISSEMFGYEYIAHFYLYSCPVCDMPNVARRGEDDDGLEWISTGVRGKDFPDVPSSLAQAAGEAHVCLNAGAYRGAILLARAVVEASCKEKGITTGTLAAKIDALHEQRHINDQVHAEATEIRHLGNDMAHGDFTEETTATDAEDVLGFMAEVLEELFQRPARLARRQAKRLAR